MELAVPCSQLNLHDAFSSSRIAGKDSQKTIESVTFFFGNRCKFFSGRCDLGYLNDGTVLAKYLTAFLGNIIPHSVIAVVVATQDTNYRTSSVEVCSL